MRKWLNNYFELSKSEFNGLLVLTGLILCLAVLPHACRLLAAKPAGEAASIAAAIELLEQEKAKSPVKIRKTWPLADKKTHPVLFHFDPNTLPLEGWTKLGLSERQAAAILRYISKGGKFRSKEDLEKMYTLRPELYQKLEAFVRIPAAGTKNNAGFDPARFRKAAYPKPELRIIELNTADSAGLCEVRGIGPAFARRIIRYRERIGGFHQKNQLLEVFGLDSLKYQEISNQLSVDAGQLKKININTATKEDFKNHPYLRYKQINALIEYRKQHGNYTDIADLEKVLILEPATIARIAPYLNFK